jgi:lactoylglutathione lyase
MSRIVHIALKCGTKENLESAVKLYEDVFGIYTTYDKYERGHLSHHMTDGNIDLALMLYDSEDEKEAKLAGAGPRIHHIGIEVDDRPSMIAKIEANGGKIFGSCRRCPEILFARWDSFRDCCRGPLPDKGQERTGKNFACHNACQ